MRHASRVEEHQKAVELGSEEGRPKLNGGIQQAKKRGLLRHEYDVFWDGEE